MGTLDDNSWIHDIQKLVQQFQRLAEKESLTEKTTEPFLEILKQLRDIVNMIPADKHQDTMKVSLELFPFMNQYNFTLRERWFV